MGEAKAKAKIEERVQERDEQARKGIRRESGAPRSPACSRGKTKGREPQAPQTDPKAKDQINLTDDESRIMPTVQGYNAQAAVDVETMLVPTTTVTQERNDKQQVEPMLEELQALPEELGKLEALLADNGYFSHSKVEACVAMDVTPLIAAGRECHHVPLQERLAADQAPPETEDLWFEWFMN